MQKPTDVPKGWDLRAHQHWQEGRRQEAVDAVLAVINSDPSKPIGSVLQLAYYVFLCGDPAGAARFLEVGRVHHPGNAELLLNLSVCLYRSGQYEMALQRIEETLALRPDDMVALDGKCSSLSCLGRYAEAAQVGTKVLLLKDEAAAPPQSGWQLPAVTPEAWAATPGKRPVIAFSLWGNHARYLEGALDNAMEAQRIYPGWQPVFFVDDSVPSEVQSRLVALGSELRHEPAGQPLRQKLAWRFKVASDPKVGRFLVRDADSVVSERERAAVDAWMASGRWFHVMRDWWTHTDLVLAGMWGGVAGVLPNLTQLLATYRPNAAETPNVDQWFLRDVVWGYVRTSCLVHDRCFTPPGSQPWPVATPEGSFHVGQNAYAVRRATQAARTATIVPVAERGRTIPASR